MSFVRRMHQALLALFSIIMKSLPGIYFIVLVALFIVGCTNSPQSKHQEEVAARGAEVMPFDLERSTHIFEKTENGGQQQVISDDRDLEQIQLIQSHLRTIATQFSQGNFHDPQMIHGEDMAGLHALMMGADRLDITYTPLETGGQIIYTSDESELVNAIHQWFDAQVSDHGSHAQGHH